MKKYKSFSKKYYAKDVIERVAKFYKVHSAHIGRLIHDGIEGKQHENNAWRYGGSASVSFEDSDFVYTLRVYRKSRKEKTAEEQF